MTINLEKVLVLAMCYSIEQCQKIWPDVPLYDYTISTLNSAEHECRPQSICKICHFIHRFHRMIENLLRSRSFFLHFYLRFSSRESGYGYSLFVGTSDRKNLPDKRHDVLYEVFSILISCSEVGKAGTDMSTRPKF